MYFQTAVLTNPVCSLEGKLCGNITFSTVTEEGNIQNFNRVKYYLQLTRLTSFRNDVVAANDIFTSRVAAKHCDIKASSYLPSPVSAKARLWYACKKGKNSWLAI